MDNGNSCLGDQKLSRLRNSMSTLAIPNSERQHVFLARPRSLSLDFQKFYSSKLSVSLSERPPFYPPGMGYHARSISDSCRKRIARIQAARSLYRSPQSRKDLGLVRKPSYCQKYSKREQTRIRRIQVDKADVTSPRSFLTDYYSDSELCHGKIKCSKLNGRKRPSNLKVERRLIDIFDAKYDNKLEKYQCYNSKQLDDDIRTRSFKRMSPNKTFFLGSSETLLYRPIKDKQRSLHLNELASYRSRSKPHNSTKEIIESNLKNVADMWNEDGANTDMKFVFIDPMRAERSPLQNHHSFRRINELKNNRKVLLEWKNLPSRKFAEDSVCCADIEANDSASEKGDILKNDRSADGNNPHESKRDDDTGVVMPSNGRSKARTNHFKDVARHRFPKANLLLDRSNMESKQQKPNPMTEKTSESLNNQTISNCKSCSRYVDIGERLEFLDDVFHRSCFKCSDCGIELLKQEAVLRKEIWTCAKHMEYSSKTESRSRNIPTNELLEVK